MCENKEKVHLHHEDTNIIKILRQGMSPILFNLYREWLRKDALEGVKNFRIGERSIASIKNADGLISFAKKNEALNNEVW